MSTHEKIRHYIESNLVTFDASEAPFTDDDNIFEKGFLNSMFAMQMLTYIETEFNLTVDNDDLELINFSTVNNIVGLIEKKQRGRSSA
ncbi:acyl carrier protein [Marininema halotolerans]|uniref:Phosphopantetheine attachment site n=1 Tax=Marininema halotolerans TaxID=1155944 RepID=A0A1I6PWG0_9BACL|nr:phosphopantetheine-binding protein [Marininema halotolerans]SFS44534.1 Phosphopantetheine attachment site [Marininema halotolerans]